MRRALSPVAVVLAVVALAGCGSSGQKIPRSNATDLIALLHQAQLQSQGKPDCRGLTTDTVPALERGVSGLPGKTDKDIRSTLDEGIANLRSLIQAKCAAQSTTSSSTTTSTSTPTTTSTTTTPTTTTTSTSTTFTPPPTTTTRTTTAPPTNPSGGVPPGQAKKGNG